MISEPKVLIFQHNPMSQETANGKTLGVLFSQFPAQNLAQIYITEQKMNTNMCGRYYHISEHDMLKRRSTNTMSIPAANDAPIYHRYQEMPFLRPYITMLRDWLWRQNRWDTPELRNWIEDFVPDCLFFSAGDIVAEYDIAVQLCQRYHIPMILHVGDDYFTFKKRFPLLQSLYQNRMRRSFCRTYDFAKIVAAISDTMKETVIRTYGNAEKHYVVAMNAIDPEAVFPRIDHLNDPIRISYIGNLGLNRMDTVFVLCDAIKILAKKHIRMTLTLYSRSQLSAKQLDILRATGVCEFAGSLDAKEYVLIVESSDMLLHVESFREKRRKVLESSFSTKTPELLFSGRPALIIGPKYSATVSFFEKDNCGITILSNDPIKVADAIEDALKNQESLLEMTQRAGKLAVSQFGKNETGKRIRDAVIFAVDDNRATIGMEIVEDEEKQKSE